jgi:vitamin B12 transporter
VTSNVSVIDSEFIRNSSAMDLADVLAGYGMEINNDNGFLSGVGMRGFKTDPHGFELGGRVTVLIDGRRSVTGNLSKIPTSNIERVEIIRGPAASTFGPSAMGGVINVITKSGSGPLSAEARAGIGSYGLFQGGLSLSGEASGFDYRFDYGRSERDDMSLPNGDVWAYSRWQKMESASVNAGYTNGRHRVGFSGTLFDVDANFHGNYTRSFNPRRTDRSNSYGELNYSGATEDGAFSWSARYGVGKDDEVYDSILGSGYFRYWTHARIGSAQVSYDRGGMLAVSLGADYAYYDMMQTWEPYKTDTLNTAGYLTGKLRLLEDSVILSFGGRYDSYRLREKETPGDKDRSDTNFSPSVGLAWLPVPWLKLRVHYAEAFLMPTQAQMYVNDGYYVGNPDLDPETSDTWEFGVDLSWQELNFSGTYFRADTENLITDIPIAGGFVSYTNIGRSVREGLEFEVNADLGPRLLGEGWSLRPYVNLNFMTKFRDSETGERLLNIPTLTAGYGVSIAAADGDVSASVRARYFGKWLATRTIMMEPFTVLDLSVTKRLADFGEGGSIALKVDVNNTLNKYYETTRGFPNAGRNFFVGAIYTY